MIVRIPGGFIRGVRTRRLDVAQHAPDATNELREEIHVHTGIVDDVKFLSLVLSIGNIAYTSELNNAGTEITWPFWGLRWHVAPIATA